MFKLQAQEHDRWKTVGYFASLVDASAVADRLDTATRVVSLDHREIVDRFLVEALPDASDESAAVVNALRQRVKNWTPKEDEDGDDEH